MNEIDRIKVLEEIVDLQLVPQLQLLQKAVTSGHLPDHKVLRDSVEVVETYFPTKMIGPRCVDDRCPANRFASKELSKQRMATADRMAKLETRIGELESKKSWWRR